MSNFEGLEYVDEYGNKVSIGKGATGNFIVGSDVANMNISCDIDKTITGIVAMNAENNYINGKRMPSIKNGLIIQNEKRKVYLFENSKTGMKHRCSCYPSVKIRDYVMSELNVRHFKFITIKNETDDISLMNFKDYPENTHFIINI